MLKKNKRGVSEVIGYVLLIVMVISLSFIVYKWMASYIPKDYDKCPDDVSVFIKDKQCQLGKLLLTLGNNGLFNVKGYYIKATTSEDQEVATLSLLRGDEDYIAFDTQLNPGVESSQETLSVAGDDTYTIYSIEIMPVVLDEKTNEPLVCGNSKIKEKIQCDIGDNLLANHDFESWSDYLTPLSWSAPVGGVLSLSSDKVNGFSSLQIVKSSGFGYVTGQIFNVQPGETYYFEIYMKKISGEVAWTRLSYSSEQSFVSQYNNGVWQKFSQTVTIPAGVTQIRFELGGSSMTALYDGAVLRKV